MKKILSTVAALSFLFVFTGVVHASANPDNPNVVAYYPTGDHGIPGEYELHTGMDTVMAAGQSGNFQQWFYGTSATDGLHGDHTVWMIEGPNGCQSGWMEMVLPNPAWGDYLTPGVNYCVKTNDYH